MNANTENKQFGFNSKIESEYLQRLEKTRRREVLVAEVATAVGEAKRFSFNNIYQWSQGKIVDEKSGESLRVLLQRGQRSEETQALEEIEIGLEGENRYVINFSPANAEFGYPKGVVDFWYRDENDKVMWSRVTTDNSFVEMKNLYSQIGGGEINNESEMLSKPIVAKDDLKIDDILSKLKIKDDNQWITQEKINQTVEYIVDDFIKKFGEDLIIEADKIFRVYSLAMNEIKNWTKEKIEIGRQILNDYAFKPLIMTFQKVFGCSAASMVGQVGTEFQTIYGQLKNSREYFNCPKCDGKIPSGKGIETCPHCGMTKQEAGSVCD